MTERPDYEKEKPVFEPVDSMDWLKEPSTEREKQKAEIRAARAKFWAETEAEEGAGN